MTPEKIRDALVIAAFKGNPKAVAVIVTWRESLFDSRGPHTLSAYTTETHLEAAIFAGMKGANSAIYNRDSLRKVS